MKKIFFDIFTCAHFPSLIFQNLLKHNFVELSICALTLPRFAIIGLMRAQNDRLDQAIILRPSRISYLESLKSYDSIFDGSHKTFYQQI